VTFNLCESFSDSLVVSRYQAIISANKRLDRDRLWSGEGQIVAGPPFALFAPIDADAVSAVARPEEFARLGMQPFANRLKLLPRSFAVQTEQLRTPPMPLTLHPAMLVIVIAVFEMPLGIPNTARHGSYGQHIPTLTLFEFRVQVGYFVVP
jgi:hypothetical protein